MPGDNKNRGGEIVGRQPETAKDGLIDVDRELDDGLHESEIPGGTDDYDTAIAKLHARNAEAEAARLKKEKSLTERLRRWITNFGKED